MNYKLYDVPFSQILLIVKYAANVQVCFAAKIRLPLHKTIFKFYSLVQSKIPIFMHSIAFFSINGYVPPLRD